MAKFDGSALAEVTAKDRNAWRAWLKKNHAKSTAGVWLIYYKKRSAIPSVGSAEAVEEALCFGWIDSVVNSLDETRYRQLYTRRKPKSVWSKLNKTRIERLNAAGLMMPTGLACIEIAKANGSWSTLDSVEALEIPPDFARALAASKPAAKNFAAFSPSVKKVALYQINAAKTDGTRAKRITDIVAQAAANIRPDHFARTRLAGNKAKRDAAPAR